MKKGLFTFAFALMCIFSFGQTLPEGSLISVHPFTPTLKEGVSMENFVNFYKTKVIPAYENAFPGVKMYVSKRLRGQDSSSVGIVFIFDTEANRNKYFNNDDTPTELGKVAFTKLNDIGKEFGKFVMPSNAPEIYTDWLVL
ncbi:hypothetical protein [Pontibacter chitinilyticus]|uniref:hypothetical protein n=1 Tax=Pontibacter chitinilyticus TaxID=2674989 RepID=UPI00321B8079